MLLGQWHNEQEDLVAHKARTCKPGMDLGAVDITPCTTPCSSRFQSIKAIFRIALSCFL